MSASNASLLQGYKCEFIGQVPEDFYCKKCTLVARRLTLTSCCGESFCQTCIADIQEQGQPCPECEEKGFTILQHVKNQKKIKDLQVYCSMKERGCVWSGTLDQLDTHLDPHLDNCQYVDTKCPLNCLQTVPKNKVDHHVAQQCSKRPHVCQHCSFKATYEEVVDTHLPECKYVILQCPNMCGVSCEREVMEDHMKICRLKEVECEFSSVGCDDQFIREDQDKHARQNSQKHLSLTASLAVETKEQLRQQLQKRDKKHKAEEEKQKKNMDDKEKRLIEQEKKLREQDRKIGEQEKKIGEQEKKLGEQEKKLGEQEKKLRGQEQKLAEQEKQLGEQEKQLGEQEKKLGEQEKKLGEQEKKLGEQEKKLGEQEKKQEKMLGEQEKKLGEQENKQGEQGRKLGEQERKIWEQENKLGEQERNLEEQKKKLGKEEKKLEKQEKKLGEQEKKLGEQEEKLWEQEKKLKEQEKKIGEQENKLGDKENKIRVQENKVEELDKIVKDLSNVLKKTSEIYLSKLTVMERSLLDVAAKSKEGISNCMKMIGLNRKFVLEKFSKEKARDTISYWKSPAMYTHVCGYKFCIGVDANGYAGGRGKSISVTIFSMPGEFDDRLKWPAKAQFSIELVNQQGGENAKVTSDILTWHKSCSVNFIGHFRRFLMNGSSAFLRHLNIPYFLNNDSLHFFVSNVTLE